MGGISPDEGRGPIARCGWRDDIEGLDDNGGDGNPAIRGVGKGVLNKEEASGPATLGDCNGDWYGISLMFAGNWVMMGGRSGVVGFAWSRTSSSCSVASSLSELTNA